MTIAKVERRMPAILISDVVGYSRLVELDEASTFVAIRELRSQVIDPLLEKHRRRVVKLMGDGAIAEFGSVVDAVSCACAVQRRAAELHADTPRDRRIVLRMGVNVGDVVVEGEDLLGDAVNIAARTRRGSACGEANSCRRGSGGGMSTRGTSRESGGADSR